MALTGAMSAGISGMKSHMEALNTTGNNVANVNTYGYKAGRVTFKESIYSTQSAAADGTELLGGVNAKQTGYGSTVGAIDLDMGTKGVESTGKPNDLAIQGDGFFVLGTKDGVTVDSLDSLLMSRVGDFRFDSDGYLVDSGGNVVYGFITCNTDPNTGDKLATAGINGDAISTQLVPIRLPMEAGTMTGANVGDAVYPGVDGAGANVPHADYATQPPIELKSMSIDSSGKIIGVNGKTGDPVVVGYIALGSVRNPSALTHTEGPYYMARGNTGPVTVSAPGGALTGYLNNATTGNPEHSIEGNSSTKVLPGFLEMSGTDLATEFANMISYQRGYQANTRIITVTDSMLEELVNIKR